jgi:transcriptional regulator with XRE-family HTH domain
MQTLGDRIKQRIRELGTTQEEVAKRAGMSQTAVHKLATGKSKRTRFLLQLADALECRPDWLLNGRGPKELYAPPLDNGLDTLLPSERALLASTSRSSPRSPSEETLAALLDRLANRLDEADDDVRDEIMRLILRYLSNPSGNARIIRAIELLLAKEGLDDPAP